MISSFSLLLLYYTSSEFYVTAVPTEILNYKRIVIMVPENLDVPYDKEIRSMFKCQKTRVQTLDNKKVLPNEPLLRIQS